MFATDRKWERNEDVSFPMSVYKKESPDPVNIRLDEDVFKTSWWRQISSYQSYIFRRRLGQDQYIRLVHTSSSRLQEVPRRLQEVPRRLKDTFKTSSRRLAITSSRRFQDVFKTSCKNFFKTSWWYLQDVFKTSSKYVLKTSSRHFEDVSSSQTVFVNKSLRSVQRVCMRYCKDRCLQKDWPRSHFWEIYLKCTNLQVLVFFQFTTPFSGCL